MILSFAILTLLISSVLTILYANYFTARNGKELKEALIQNKSTQLERLQAKAVEQPALEEDWLNFRNDYLLYVEKSAGAFDRHHFTSDRDTF